MSKNSKEVCQDCLPVIRRNHNDLWVKFWLEPFFLSYFRFIRLLIPFRRQVFNLVLGILRLAGIVRFESDLQKFNLDNRSLIFWNEAKSLDLQIYLVTVFGFNTDLFRVKVKERVFFV